MSLSSFRSVGDAIDVTRSFLMPPSLGRWSKLALVVFFFGTAGTPIPASPQLLDPRFWRSFDTEPAPDGEDGLPGTATNATGEPDATGTAGNATGEPTPPGSTADALPDISEVVTSDLVESVLPYLVTTVAVLAVLFAGYILVGILLRFVFVESLQSGDVLLRQYGRAHIRGAVGVFLARVVLVVLAVPPLALAVVAAAPFGPFQLSLAGASIVSILALTWAVLLLIADAIVQQFVIPVMVECDCGVVAGWRRLQPTFVTEWKEYFAFGFVRLGLDVAVGIGSAILLAIVGVFLAILFGTLAGVIVLVGGSLTVGSPTALALSIVGLGFLVSLVVAFAYVNVPFQTYLWYYSLLVLGDIDGELDLIPERRAEARSEENGVVGA